MNEWDRCLKDLMHSSREYFIQNDILNRVNE